MIKSSYKKNLQIKIVLQSEQSLSFSYQYCNKGTFLALTNTVWLGETLTLEEAE